MRSPRVSEMVAERLRLQILRGEVGESGRLPPQEELLQRFDVGLPSIREALRILEVEGLVTVHRGKVGGATVHLPDTDDVAYIMALVLESRKASLSDIADTIRSLEPLCAGMCAAREDRLGEPVDKLDHLVDLQMAAIDDPVKFNNLARAFHAAVVDECGNASMALTVGSMVKLWTAQERTWTELAAQEGRFPDQEVQKQIVAVHQKIVDAIRAGDSETARHLSVAHLAAAQTYHMSVESRTHVECAPLRYTQRFRNSLPALT